ncbi:MAG: peptide chain release factor N(5)-glutamine methyltransferase [Flavobacteriaceae bacterium]
MKLADARTYFCDALSAKFSLDESRFYLKCILQDWFSMDATEMALSPDKTLTTKQTEQLKEAAEKLLKDIPLQQLIGEQLFLDLNIKINSDVLIPRPETEELVQWILENYPKAPPLNTLDCGTGSGCIAIALAHSWGKSSQISAIDVSSNALRLAEENAQLNNADVSFRMVDMCLPWPFTKTFELIVSNPPYVLLSEKSEMHPRVLNYEPHLALFTPAEDRVHFYRAIERNAQTHLAKGGWLYFEINPRCEAALAEVFSTTTWQYFEIRNDTFGKARFLRVQKR